MQKINTGVGVGIFLRNCLHCPQDYRHWSHSWEFMYRLKGSKSPTKVLQRLRTFRVLIVWLKALLLLFMMVRKLTPIFLFGYKMYNPVSQYKIRINYVDFLIFKVKKNKHFVNMILNFSIKINSWISWVSKGFSCMYRVYVRILVAKWNKERWELTFTSETEKLRGSFSAI